MNIPEITNVHKTRIQPPTALIGLGSGLSPNCRPTGRRKVLVDCNCNESQCDCNDCRWEDCSNKRYIDCQCGKNCDCSQCTYDCDQCDCNCDPDW